MSGFGKFFIPLQRQGQILAVLLLCAAASLAQAQSSSADSRADPPNRVARLSYVAGDLGFLPAGATTWSDANLNRPLTIGDRLSSDPGARAELEFGGGTLRMDGGTDVGLLDLNDQLAQVELTQGTLSLSVRHLDDGQSYEIDTPTVALVIDQPGTFRVDLDRSGRDTQITAFDGDATVYGENNAQRVIHSGRSYRFTDPGLAVVTISQIRAGDGFDAWAVRRDQRYAQSDSSQYVSDDVVGYQDLDQYGSWQESSDYGAVWYPNQVAADWAPYRDGHWAYIAPWGWTWVDDMPWGYAPYHYGRWAYTRRGWGWIPGPRTARPVYAPALVAFVGGGGWSIGIGTGPVGWFPLGPGEIYNPWYRASRGYYTQVNIVNIRARHGYDYRTDIDDHYHRYQRGLPPSDGRHVNRDAPRGFTAVPGHDFAGGRNVRRNLVQVDARRRDDAPMLARGINQFRPNPDAAVMLRNAHARNLPSGAFHRDVVARHAPPAEAEAAQGMARSERANNSPRAALPVSNVRLLNTQSPQLPNPPAISRLNADTSEPGRYRNPAAGLRENAMPPTEPFARPARNENVGPRQAMPRPGVSYISTGNQNPVRPEYRGNPDLPPAAQIQRAEPLDRLSAPHDERAPRYGADRRAQPAPTSIQNMPMRSNPEPRLQQPPAAPHGYVRDDVRPAPVRSEAPRQMMPEPRYQPPQRFAAPVRAEAPQPPRNESRPERKPPPRNKEDGQQH